MPTIDELKQRYGEGPVCIFLRNSNYPQVGTLLGCDSRFVYINSFRDRGQIAVPLENIEKIRKDTRRYA